MLLDGLPRGSRYEQAKSEDVEVAKALEGVAATGAAKPPLAEWTRELEVLTHMDRRLQNLVSLMSRKPAKDKPWPTPDTGKQRLARQRAREATAHIESRLIYPDGRPVV